MASTSWLILIAAVAAYQLLIIVGTVRCQAPAPASTCRTGDNRPGRCVVLSSCSSLQQAWQLAGDLDALVALVAYVRQSLCGHDGTGVLVCCTDGVPAASAPALDAVIPIAPDVGLQLYEPFTFGPLREPSAPSAFTIEQPASERVTPAPAPMVGPAAAAADAVCGISNFTQTRVVGGRNAKLREYETIAIVV